MKICIIGTGYVGLVSGACFAEAGNHVICIDKDAEKIALLGEGQVPIFEPGLESLVRANRSEGRLRFSTNLGDAINEADVSFVAVGTPPQEDGSADLKHVLEVIGEIVKTAKKRIVIGTKSTVPVGTGDKIETFLSERTRQPFVVFSNPEFLKEGDAVNDFMKPDRIIVGTNDSSILPLLRELYAPFTRKSDRMLIMSRRSAELTKYAANAMLATRISFMNQMANLCEKTGANIHDIRRGIGSDPRIGPDFLFAGMGYGGSCFPKDVRALTRLAKEVAVNLSVVESVEQSNRAQKELFFDKIAAHFGGRQNLQGLRIAIWGLAFKARTDDVRESPALDLIDRLLAAGCRVSAYDPHAEAKVRALYEDRVVLHDRSYEALEGASALVVATDWNEFRSPDYGKMKELLKAPVIFDGRNILDRTHLEKAGFVYYGVGV